MRKRTNRKYVETKNVISSLFNANEPMPERERIEVLTQIHSAAIALSRGYGTSAHWDELVIGFNIAVNVCAMATNAHIGLSAVNGARNALINVRERAHEVGRYGFTGDELIAVNGGIHVYEQIVSTVSRRQYVAACAKYTRELNTGQAMKIKQGQKTKRFKTEYSETERRMAA
jgi:hypothetical protein